MPKFKVGNRVRANTKAPGNYEGRDGIVIEVVRAQTTRRQLQYRVRFTPMQGEADKGYFDSWMLDLAP